MSMTSLPLVGQPVEESFDPKAQRQECEERGDSELDDYPKWIIRSVHVVTLAAGVAASKGNRVGARTGEDL